MRTLIALLALLASGSLAHAGELRSAAVDQVDAGELRAVGRLNINLASRAELLQVGLDAGLVDRILSRRARAPIGDLVGLPSEMRRRLKTDGASDYYRIRKLPLERYDLVANR